MPIDTTVMTETARGTVHEAAVKLLAYCRENDWAGHDPYDALNSELFQSFPILDSRLPRLVFTQVLKRSPIDLRRLLRIPKTQNAKAMSLFLSAFVNLHRIGLVDKDEIRFMIDRIIALRSQDTPYWCWGYSFAWQTRTIVVPRATPNLVCTAFVASALLNAYDEFGDPRCLEMAVSAARYISETLYWTGENAVASF